MKVTITPEFQEKYNELFADMQAELQKHGLNEPKVEDLVTYFQALALLQDKGTPPAKFYRIPLEEPAFEVDMSTRLVSVPPAFAVNGLGVQGDTMAEIVWFKIVRWFDVMDLSAPEQCVVQWRNSNNLKVKTGHSPAIFRIQTEDEIYFGWVITAEMTEQSGVLEFAPRFYTEKDGKLQYSIATQKASCPIHATLNLDALQASIDEQLENLIITRPIFSNVINSLDGAAPSITTNLVAGSYDLVIDEKYADDDLYKNGVLELKVAAASPNKGTIEYRWYRGKEQQKDKNGLLDTDDTFIAYRPGTYFAQIGNTTEKEGTRWVNSATVVIPEPHPITVDNAFVTALYSTGEIEDSIHMNVLGAVEGDQVQYTWGTVAENKPISEANVLHPIDDATGATFTPEENFEGIVACKARNYRNNAFSNEVQSAGRCIVRAMPARAQSVSLSYSGASSNVLSVSANFGDHPSKNHSDEWVYTWSRSYNFANGQVGSEILGSSVIGADPTAWQPKLEKPTKPGDVNQYTFTCQVAHTVFKGTDMARTSAATSAEIKLEVDYNGNVVKL